MLNWKRIEQVLGESVREIGILVIVFAPLDAAFAEHPTDLDAVTRIMLSALGLIIVGIVLETGSEPCILLLGCLRSQAQLCWQCADS